MTKSKPVVHYLPSNFNSIRKGQAAMVWPIDHPGEDVSNTTMVRTSTVIAVGADWFETLNTRYVLSKGE